MFWQDDKKQALVSQQVADVSFKANAKCLPGDHAYDLFGAIYNILPWIKTETQSAIHLIYGADSGNGWQRPDNASDLIYLSRRTRFSLRVPTAKVDETIEKLNRQSLDVAGFRLELQEPHVKELLPQSTIYSRNVVGKGGETEQEFLSALVKEIKKQGIQVKKIMCGRTHSLKYPPTGKLITRSVMLAELDPADSMQLQTNGVGDYKFLGCGVFLPHKTAEAVPRD